MKNYKKVDVNDNVFNFKNNSLKWHQRRSYGGSSKKIYYCVPFKEIINRNRH